MATQVIKTPGRPGRKPNPNTPPKKLGVYRIYNSTDDGGEHLVYVTKYAAKNAEDAIGIHLRENDPSDLPYVVVPERNISTLSAQVENVPRVRINNL